MLASMQPEPEDIDITTHTLRSGADFLQFAVAFAQMDLERLRQGDWLNLREEFEERRSGERWRPR